MIKKSLTDIRRQYGQQELSVAHAKAEPMAQFKLWFNEVLELNQSELSMDPTAMVVATVDAQQRPDTRIVLLKDIIDESFVFYTNYQSAKGQQLAQNSHIALNFYWPVLCRQVRVRGTVKKASTELSDSYFSSRPLESQISAFASAQSEVLANRDELKMQVDAVKKQFAEKIIERPPHWGGYAVTPDEFEFWQGRDNRLHDRLRYTLDAGSWRIERLAP